MKAKHLLLTLGGAAVLGIAALWPREARAARKGTTINEGHLRIALERLAAFLRAAKIDATATSRQVDDGLALRVIPGRAFVVEDSRAIPRQVDGLDVEIVGWPR